MTLNQKKFDEIENLLKIKLNGRITCTEENETKYLNIENSNFWMSTEFNEFVVCFGINHTHFSEKYDNLKEGIIQVFDLITNDIRRTEYIKGETTFKIATEILYANSESVNIGTTGVLIYPFWKKTKVKNYIYKKIIKKSEIQEEANKILECK